MDSHDPKSSLDSASSLDSTSYLDTTSSLDSTSYLDSTSSLDYYDYAVLQATAQFQPSVDFISDEAGNMFRLINFVVLCTLIGLFGIFTNIINMTVFYRQGFTTTTNISFFALAISDMLCLITTQWFVICLNPYLKKAGIQFIPEEVQYLSAGWLHVCFGRITSWITVFITAERCMGISLPLKVKQIITLRRTTIVMCTIFIINLGILLPEYSVAYLDWKFDEARNRSLFGVVYRGHKDQVAGLIFILTSVSGILSFICVIILTIFLVSSLERKSKWREAATGGSDKTDSRSSREKKTVKMIIMIASVLIVCYIPGTAVSLVTAFVPEFTIKDAFANSFFAFWSIAFVFDTINSSVNVFLYYRMSTKYKQTFKDLFSACLKTDPGALKNKRRDFKTL